MKTSTASIDDRRGLPAGLALAPTALRILRAKSKCQKHPTMNPAPLLRAFCTAISLALLLCLPASLQAAAPDLTATGVIATIDRTWTYNLGATGMRGWIYSAWPETPGRAGTTAFAPYQILVTTVAASTPAAGILATDDVILGASTGSGSVPLFTSDARMSLGWAIGAAEAADGILKLKRWRAGVTTDVSVTLAVMGAYSDTAPYNCPKTALILTNAANSLQQKISANGWGDAGGAGAVSALALLATGNSAYLPMLQAYARSIAPQDLDLETDGISAWNCYNSIFLAEYYMLTNDAAVFHGLSEYVIYAATHSSMFGTAGHGFSNVPPPGGWVAGGPHGLMSWYGPVNQAGLAAQLSIVLGKKAGVVSPEIDPAIDRAAKFFGYYVNRGSIPYGEHQPYPGDYQLPGQSRTYYDHCSNGKDGLAAVMFACMGDKPVQTEYFARMCVAGFGGEQYGHTGQGFSYLWTMLGANVGGTTAAAEYQKKVRWDRDLKRRCDGSFVYEGGEQWAPGQAATYWDDSYTYWGYPTAYYLLHATLPLKQLYITGKNADPANVLGADVVSNALWACDFTSQCGSYTKDQLVAALAEWDPIVRFNAATELATRTLTTADVNSLIVMAENPADANQREAACTALGCLGATGAVPALTRRLKDTDIWVRAKAAKALGQVSATATAASVPDMLGAFVSNVAPTYPFEAGFNWDDPLQIANGYLSETLFSNLGSYTISADKSLLYPAVRAGIKQPAGMWRGQLDDFVQNQLTLSDVEALIPDLLEDASVEGPCDRMFTVTPPAAAMNALSKYHIQEGLQVCFDNVAYWGDILGATAIARLADYGEAARWTLPELYADLAWWTHDNNYAALVSTVAALEAATTSPAQVYALPEADPQIVATPANTPKPLILTGSSCRTNPVAYTVATRPAHGTLTGTAPNLSYTPASGYQGMDSFTFTVTDSMADSSPATVNLVVGAGGSGLTGLYYDNMDFTSLKATRIDPSVNFDWGSTPPNTLGAGTYSVRWTGQVLAPESGTYRFSTRTSDGVRLWVNGQQVINDWNDQAANLWNDSAPIALTAGQKYSIKMEYYNNANPATARLYWYIPSRQAAMIIPQELIFPVSGVSLTSPLNGARFGLQAGQPTSVTLTADTSDVAGTVTNVSFYNGDTLIGSDTSAPYSMVWTNVPAGQYGLTAKATDSTGGVSTSAVAVIGVDGYTVPVTTGLACHFDAAVGVTTDVDGVVQSWSDRSGNAHDATLSSGTAVLAPNQIMSQPAIQLRGNATWFNIAGAFFTQEQYVVVRSPNATWNGSGTFLGRKSDDFLSVRASSYNMANGTDGFWQDHFPAAVSKNGTPLAQNNQNGSAFHLAPITDYMLLKITVDNQASAANLAQYPYYQIGKNETLGTMDFDVAEIIGYTNSLSASDEALVGGYLAAKYGITTTYPATGSLANRPASAVTDHAAALNATLMCNGGNYDVVAYWGRVNGGMNPANWANSAAIGSWNNMSSLDISRPLIGLAPGTTYYFTFRASNAANTLWPASPLSFTTISTAKDMLTFGDNVAGSSATIDTVAGTVAWSVPYGASLTNLAPAYTVSPLASCVPASGISKDFSTPQTYIITAQDLSTKVYTVTATVGAASSACDILSFGPGAVITGNNIAMSVPYGTNLANLAPTYTVSSGASGAPASGVAPTPNLASRSPATYTITAPNGTTTKTYYVTLSVLAFNPPQVSNTSIVGDWSFLNSQNPGWSLQRTTTLTASGIQLGSASVGEGMMSVAKPAALSFINSGVEMIFTGTNTVGNNAGYAYISMYRDGGNPPRNAYGITATDFTASGGRLTTSVNNGTTGGEIITSSSLANANFVGKHTMALVRFDDNTLKAFLDGVEIGSRTSDAPSLTLGYIGVGANYFGGATYLPRGTLVERVRAFTFPSGGFNPNDLLVLPAAALASASTSTLVASPTIVANNGSATSTLCVTLKDASGNPLAGKSVTLVSTRGATDTFSAASVTSNLSGVASFTVKSSTAGSPVFTATDATDGMTLTQTATVTFSASLAPTTTLARHAGTGATSGFGDLLQFDVTVAGGSGTPTGIITLKDGGAAGTTLGSTALSSGTCSITTPALAVGTHSNIVAVYGGNSTYATSTSSALSTQTVNPAAPTGLTATIGTAGSVGLTWDATLGATSYKLSIKNMATLVEQVVTTTAPPYAATGLTNGTSYQFKVLATGSVGDGPYSGVVSATPIMPPSATTLAAYLGTAGPYGAAVTFTATVDVTNGQATGTVAFMDGAVLLGTGTLSAGQVNFTTSALAAGTHSITASYAGDASFAASTASALGYTVTPMPLTITGVTASDKIYDGTPAATLTGGTASGAVSGDTVTVSPGSGTFASVNVGTQAVTATGYALGGPQAGNYVLSAQPTVPNATITARPLILTGTRPYDGTTAAVAGVWSIANNVDGPNLTLSGASFVAAKDVGSQALVTGTPIVRVQSATGNTGSSAATTISVPLGATPANGNTLVAVIATRGTSAGRVSAISGGGVVWTRVSQAANANGTTTEIWYGPNVSNGGTAISITQASLLSAAVVMEYGGVLAAASFDVAANGTGNSSTATTGITAATAQAYELCVGGIGLLNSGYSLGNPSNSFAAVATAKSTNSTAGSNSVVYALEKIITTSGTTSSGGTISTSSQWSSAMATFKAAQATPPPGVPIRVQAASGNTGSSAAATIGVPLGATPANGNTLVAVIATRGTSSNRISAIAGGGVTWTRVSQATNTNGTTTEIWYGPNVSAGGTAISVTQASLLSAAVVLEYAGVLVPTSFDVAANNTGNSAAATTGTIASTAQAVELYVGGIGLPNSGYSLGQPNNSFAALATAKSTNASAASNSVVCALEKIVTANGTAGSGATVSTSSQWSGAIATFKAATLSLGGSAAANYTLTGLTGSLLVTPHALTVTANNQSKTYGQAVTFGSGSTLFASSGLQNGETIGSVNLTCGGGAAAAADPSYPITPGAATGGTFAAGNYSITYVNGTLTVTGAPYSVWASDPAQGLTTGVNDGPLDDPDHDGMTNQQEFAFGLNPTSGKSANPITQPLDPASGRFQYTRRVNTGLTYQVFTSTTLGAWALDSGATEVAVTTNGAIQTVTVHVSTAPINGKLFVRVQAQ